MHLMRHARVELVVDHDAPRESTSTPMLSMLRPLMYGLRPMVTPPRAYGVSIIPPLAKERYERTIVLGLNLKPRLVGGRWNEPSE
jgi:hypothetical protein